MNKQASEMETAENQDKLLDHEYDGIREYDNPTPGWWHLVFIGSVIFSVFYFIYYHTSEMSWSVMDKYERAVALANERLFGDLGELEPTQETMLAVMNNDKTAFGLEPDHPLDFTNYGRTVFASNCSQCHGSQGGGINGPNLTDDAYKNVDEITDIYDVITQGIVAKGMPAWDVKLNQNQRIIVSAYVASLRGTSPPNPKAPEGDPIDPWPQYSPESEETASAE